MSEVEKLKALLRRKQEKEVNTPSGLLSTGSTLLNLACSGRPEGAYSKGKYYFYVGASRSGKTWLALSAFAEAQQHPAFQDYRFIYDNVEDGALMNWGKFFGPQVAQRIEPPRTIKKEPVYSTTIEEFYDHLDDAQNAGPCIYILDSMDALSSQDEEAKYQEQKTARRENKTAAGSYGDGKAKKNSAMLRRAMTKLRKTGSILIVISQERDNLGFGFEKKTRSGGRALRFYATLEVWTSIKQKLKKKVLGKDRPIGNLMLAEVKKNRLKGMEASVTIPIYFSHGIDDTGSLVDFLLEEKHWGKRGGTIDATEFDFVGTREDLIQYIETNNREKLLKKTALALWRKIEDACTIQRKPRYH